MCSSDLLSLREREVVARRFGIPCERLSQIEAQALRKLSHPSRGLNLLKDM